MIMIPLFDAYALVLDRYLWDVPWYPFGKMQRLGKHKVNSPNDGKGRKLLEVEGEVEPETCFKKSCDGL